MRKPAGPIHLLERDYFLGLRQPADPIWPPERLEILQESTNYSPSTKEEDDWKRKRIWLGGNWSRGTSASGGFLWRELRKADWHNPEKSLFEAVVRFPSAPLFGCQRKLDYQFRLEPVHQHTLRLLTASQPTGRTQIQRIFLLFNGLNEIDHLEFYYQLAGMLIDKPEVACLVYPYPGHLTRYPMIGRYAERPLQRFITDPSDLFRQYLRFMIEMQWLLSTLVSVSYYPVTPGTALLAEDGNPKGGRCDPECLSKEIFDAWQAIFVRSMELLKEIKPGLKEMRDQETLLPRQEDIRQSIAVLRDLVGWKCFERQLTTFNQNEPLPAPRLHVIGYSLGGYLAQSVFLTWPFAVSSCTTLCSGGALHDLRPVKFAHEEEWRAITHGLNYEIESGMLERRFRIDDSQNTGRSVLGIPASLFSSYFRIFNDVFLQDPHGSYRSRVFEFAPRFLFVVGGNDPIVTMKSVLDASPREGINMIEIANLSHFIAREGGEWSSFWLPTIARIISLLSERTEILLSKSVLSNLWNDETTGPAGDQWPEIRAERRRPAGVHEIHGEVEPLDGDRMQTSLLKVITPLKKGKAFLFILRNQVPVVLLGQRMLHRRGSVPHYEDFLIRIFWEELQQQRKIMRRSSRRITLVVPGRLNEWFVREPSMLSVKSLPLAREIPGQNRLQLIWDDFLREWEKTSALHRFDPELAVDVRSSAADLERMVREDTSTPFNHPVLNCLPDVWIGMSPEVVRFIAGEQSGTGRQNLHEDFMRFACSVYKQSINKATLKNKKKQEIDVLEEWLERGYMHIIRVSAAQSSPQFLGERIWSRNSAVDLIVHSALALPRSVQCIHQGDFARGWPRSPCRAQPWPVYSPL